MRCLPIVVLLLSVVGLSGCACNSRQIQSCDVVFPPQKVMEAGDYAGFLADNQKLLAECGTDSRCEVALFNLGFVHAYSRSPYFDNARALKYFGQLVKEHPRSPLAYESVVWMDLITKSMALDRKKESLEKKGRRLQGQLKSKNATIEGLREQIKGSRDIDVEMGIKEREVLH